jgi:hypothetical protein
LGQKLVIDRVRVKRPGKREDHSTDAPWANPQGARIKYIADCTPNSMCKIS